jgi:ACS family D-galactonate transporter-like MFS transporter
MAENSQSSSYQAAPEGARPTRVRFVVLSMLAVATMINYMDRTILGIAATAVKEDLGLSAAVMGIVLSAFSWSYTAFQIPGGMFLDRFGSKLTYFLAFTLWSACTALLGFAAGLKSLLATLFGLGACESPCFPTNSRVVSTWFPQNERGVATSIYTVGEYIGLAAFGPILFWILSHYGWRALFIIVGIVGILFAQVWWVAYRDPHESKRVNKAELDLIAAGGGLGGTTSKRLVLSGTNIRKLLCFRQIWGACIGQFGGNSTLVFFLTWFPTYLATERHMSWIKAGFFTVLPYLSAAVGVTFGGWASDKLLKKTGSANLARKLPMIAGLLGASTIISANFVAGDVAVIAIMSFAFFSQGITGLGWTLISDIAPRDLAGLTGGVFNLFSNLAGIVTPIVIGLIVNATGSFYYALAYVGTVALVGALSYIFVLGDVRRLEIH